MKTFLVCCFLPNNNPKDKERKMTRSKLVALLFVALFILYFASPIFSEDSYKVRYTAEFSAEELYFDKIMGYDLVRLKDGSQLAVLGKPTLPSWEIKIALPSGMVVQRVQIVSTTQEEIPGEFNIFPILIGG